MIPDLIIEMTWYELFLNIWPYNFLVLYSCVLFIIATIWLYKYYQWRNIIIRKLLIFGAFLSTFGDIFSYWTVYSEALYSFPYFDVSFIFPYLLTYLILTERLFDARWILLQIVRWILIGGTGISVGFALYWIFGKYGLITHFEFMLLIVDLIPMIIILWLSKSHRIRSLFRLSDVVHLENDAFEFTASSAVYTSNTELSDDILKTLQWGLKITNIQLIWRQELKKYPKITKALTYDSKKINILSFKEATLEKENNTKIDYLEEIEKLGELCIPIYIKKELSYILILPEKNSQAPYTSQEKKIIITLRPKIALSLQILEYNKSLQDEVEKQTEQINEQKKKLEESYKKLEALDREKDVFMNMAAHELRTPMTIIRGYADILLDGGSGGINSGQKKLIENINKSCESLIALVNDLLDLSRIDAGKMELRYELCNIQELIETTFENFTSLMKSKNMDFTLEKNIDENQEFVTDRAKLSLLLNNLLSNAYKYTPENGKVHWKIWTEKEKWELWLNFSVSDTGVGIPENEIDRVFDRFAKISTHNAVTSNIQSTGLGLSIVRKIAIGMWWDIKVESQVGKWSTFMVKLPYASKDKIINYTPGGTP